MYTKMLKAKIHRATVTQVELDYEGSCGIDRNLLEKSGIRPNEQIDVYNITNGKRLTTYAIVAPAGSGMISLNGAAAHYAKPGHLVIVCAYGLYAESELDAYEPVIVHVDPQNRVREVRPEYL
ncbi:aspartate 1-decarboxylase [Marinobacter halodurans]|uniref:Aspartate 1-decarboxylase n=1 Tax=Marinobacter halodurans TaxID=2528979 RepID=A0ABY1ZJZ1_9GAMM|nr:aspartate 1-decarboxylase [Marinobacter halodurans]TBW50331.1 aspartate 1-decarboxylase [Marinobacter halodurans]